MKLAFFRRFHELAELAGMTIYCNSLSALRITIKIKYA